MKCKLTASEPTADFETEDISSLMSQTNPSIDNYIAKLSYTLSQSTPNDCQWALNFNLQHQSTSTGSAELNE